MLQFDRKVFVFTGQLAAMQRRQAEEAVEARGGMIAGKVSMTTHYIVVGALGSASWKFGEDGGRKLAAAKFKHGTRAEVISEAEFLQSLEATPCSISAAPEV